MSSIIKFVAGLAKMTGNNKVNIFLAILDEIDLSFKKNFVSTA